MSNPLTHSLAFAAAALFTAACGAQAPEATMAKASTGEAVKCQGINDCKGHGSCGGAESDCKGHNSCKGKGWMETSRAECEAKGGKVI